MNAGAASDYSVEPPDENRIQPDPIAAVRKLTALWKQRALENEHPPVEEMTMSETRPSPAPPQSGLGPAEPLVTFKMRPEDALQPQTAAPPNFAQAVKPPPRPTVPAAATPAAPSPAPVPVERTAAPQPRPAPPPTAPRTTNPAVPFAITVVVIDQGYGEFFYVVPGSNADPNLKPLAGSNDPDLIGRVVARWATERRRSSGE